MYVAKPDLGFRPPAPEQKIWRYINLDKFISLLETRALFFASAAGMDDPYEARQPTAAMQDTLDFLNHPFTKEHLAASHYPPPEELVHQLGRADDDNSQDVGLNCWHCNEGESAAMWDLYASRQAGVAIQTTFKRLCESLSNSPGEQLASLVTYGDDGLHPGTLGTCLHKRKSFKHEDELRLVVYPLSNIRQRTGEQESLKGTYVPVDVERLIERVMVAPCAKPYYLDVVRSVVKRYGFKWDPDQSALYTGPLY